MGLIFLCTALIPAASADHDPVHYAQEVVGEATDYAGSVVGMAAELLPACAAATGQWAVACADGTTFAGCGTDAAPLYRCRLAFEGHGGDVDGAGAATLAATATSIAGAAPGRAGATASRLAGAGTNLAATAISEVDSWNTWTAAQASAFTALAFATKQPYQDLAVKLVAGAQAESGAFAQRTADDTETAIFSAINNGAAPDYRFTAAFDSGPVTVFATDKRPADDPCNPNSGLRVFGSDCRGPMFFNANVKGSLDCNAYTSIALAQPCGGFVSRDWNWNLQGNAVYPQPLQAARLAFGPDGRATVHDALGVLHCNAPQHENGYWLQSFHLSVSESTFNENPLGHQDANSLAVFGDDAGTCMVSAWGSGYRITYDVLFNGAPTSATGTFAPEGQAQNLAGCDTTADTRSPGSSAACEGVIHTGDS